MALPDWSRGAPGPGFEHGDNYSDLEVVWTEAGTGLVVVETRGGYNHPAIVVDAPPTVEWGVDNPHRQSPPESLQETARRLFDEQVIFDPELLRSLAPPQPRWTRVEVGIASALGGGLTVGFLVHFLPWLH